MKLTTNTSRFQVSGVRCQQLKSTRWMDVAHELDFLSPPVTFSLNQSGSRTQDWFFTDT
ncbi:hypothetical protein D1AOALGA4SA_7312 [Olavius algarvensis Delta 1 endosymbiont]|nr:hypothetical protein D1AOALGA4SA_7312 [Olavius algarvensis Delta 1 endosymbiont]